MRRSPIPRFRIFAYGSLIYKRGESATRMWQKNLNTRDRVLYSIMSVRASTFAWFGWIALAVFAGCASRGFPRIDPTGERIFAAGKIEYDRVPDEPKCSNTESVCVFPGKVIAPVGAEVVMLAGVCGPDGLLRANQRVEWSLAPGGVGHFVQIGQKNPIDCLWPFRDGPEKIDNSYAIGHTAAKYILLTRGSPTPSDDVPVSRGQAWLTVTSPVEGTSYVTAYAPTAYAWETRKQTSSIHWVDAQYAFPPPAVNPTGTSHTFTTTLSRHSNQTPLVGWRVRYEIRDGPPAGLGPEQSSVLEVLTDSLGQASVEIRQTAPAAGMNNIDIRIIRPSELDPTGGEPFELASGSTSKTWTTPDLSLSKTGPAQATLGSNVTYRLRIDNPSDLTAKELLVTEVIPRNMSFVRGDPAPVVTGDRIEWRLGDLQGGEERELELTLRADRLGVANNCATVQALDGRNSQDCVATTVVASAIDVSITGPARAQVGDNVTFRVLVVNRGSREATDLVVVDRYADGFQHESGANPIESVLDTLAPGASIEIDVTLRVTRPGRQCNVVEIQNNIGTLGSSEACVTIEGDAADGDSGAAAEAAAGPAIEITVDGPVSLDTGEVGGFSILVRNTGDVPLTDLRIVDRFDVAFRATEATRGHREVGDDFIWTIDRLAAGETRLFQLKLEGLNPKAKACNRAKVSSAEGASDEAETCLAIVRPTAGLKIRLIDETDPIRLGKDASYRIKVTNQGAKVERAARVEVTLPPELRVIRETISAPVGHVLDGPAIEFQPIDEIAPGEEVSFAFKARTLRLGQVTVTAELTAAGLSESVLSEQATDIVPAR